MPISQKFIQPRLALNRLRARTPARILTGRAGAAYRTATWLELRADHAAARDAVHAELDLEERSGKRVDCSVEIVRGFYRGHRPSGNSCFTRTWSVLIGSCTI